MIRTLVAALATTTCIVALATPAAAQTREYNIPAGSLKSALDAYVRQSGRQVVYRADEVRTARSPGARGQLSADAALANLLAGSGFTTRLDGNLIAIVKAGNGDTAESVSSSGNAIGSTAADNDSAEILVTGSRIRGAEPTSPVIRITGEQMKDSGLPTFGDVVRSIPQNWAGGQNPGVSPGVQGVDNRNVTSSSTINLRGLGPDATLTLLNGHRLAYDFSTQGVDVGAIPIAAIDRLEVVADGASALYGSDAVAGVVNVLLKRDFDGLTTTARFGAATDGGNVQQEYGVVAGKTWQDGGFMAVYDFQKNTPIFSRQRSYTETLQDEQHLYPAISQHSAILTGYQSLSDTLIFSADATYSTRKTHRVDANTLTQSPTAEGTIADVKTDTFSITPRLDLELGGSWRMSLLGTFAQSKSDSVSILYIGSVARYTDRALYDNKTYNVEFSADGTLFDINGNRAGLAVGAGYRLNSLDQSISTVSPGLPISGVNFYGENESTYAFGELELPFITPSNGAAIQKLSLSAAVRYESYKGRDSVATPKIGGAFAPIEDVEFRATWGKSFKAPTLYQLYVAPTGSLLPASRFGFSGANATGIIINGGASDLRSERSENLTVSSVFKPRFLPGFRAELSYFTVTYQDRVVRAPIAVQTAAASDPAYQSFVTRNPTIEQIDAAIALLPLGLSNGIGRPFDPTEVVAILDNRNVNVSRQKIRGVDILLSYEAGEISGGRLGFDLAASHLRSRQQLLPGAAAIQMAGTIFDPPKWRGRASATWRSEAVSLNAAVNYRGPLTDDRRTPVAQVRAMTTLDLSARITRIADSGAFANMEIGLSALNVLNEKPAPIWSSLARYVPYDSTNDSAVGRFIGLTISKNW